MALDLDADGDVLLESVLRATSDNTVVRESSVRSDFAPTSGRVFDETDTDDVYLGTGSQWVNISDVTALVQAVAQATTIERTATQQSIGTNEISLSSSYIELSAGDGTNLQTISGGAKGQELILDVQGALTIEDGTGNLKLNGDTNITADADDTVSFVYDGSDWLELAASTN